MGKIETYKEIVNEVLQSYTGRSYAPAQLANVTDFNGSNNMYTVYTRGVDNGVEVNDVYCKLQIINNVIVLLENNSDEEIEEDLIKKGVDRQDIFIDSAASDLKEFDDLFYKSDQGITPKIPIKMGQSTMGGGTFKSGVVLGIDIDELPNKIFIGSVENGVFVLEEII
jgi:hypothetical protein